MSFALRNHLMPFGTRILDDGRVNFRLWAPRAKKVELCLQGLAPETRLPMAAEDEGWYGIITEFADTGFYYQYRIDEQLYVPDPASRFQPEDVFGASQVVDPDARHWQDGDWRGLPWEDAVIYELHVGTFSEEGTFAGVKKRLDYLADLGITALQLMPIAEFPGQRNWGYDGVLLFAPDSRYGSPDDLKDLIDTAHRKGLMVFNDVVYNHFGPEGNFLQHYAPTFFNPQKHTPWGNAINFDGPNNHWVRQFFTHNALFWLEEYHFDGLRFDAIQTLFDESRPDFLTCLAETVRREFGEERHIHLILENDHNDAHYLRAKAEHPSTFYTAQWNDDFHHALHVQVTGECNGYFQDYREVPIRYLARSLAEGFAYQGEASAYREQRPRGEASADLPPTAFVNFLQNHDQVGNRAYGERLSDLCVPDVVRAVTAVLLLSPSIPMLFMGQEWAAGSPFTYFVDLPEELAERVAQGRTDYLAAYFDCRTQEQQARIAEPNRAATFAAAKLPWSELNDAPHLQCLEYHRKLLRIRNRYIRPRLDGIEGGRAGYRVFEDKACYVEWPMNDGSILKLIANLSSEPVWIGCRHEGEMLFASEPDAVERLNQGSLKPWAVVFLLAEPESDEARSSD
ncbi:MAG: malto-oligosyltrehalose trehalohydrolase [Gammaproteobacteria bacterium]